MNGVVRDVPGGRARSPGLFARTDAERGVWKAPAGTAATIVGATGLSYTLTDSENGDAQPARPQLPAHVPGRTAP